jgi:hypothetical protein
MEVFDLLVIAIMCLQIVICSISVFKLEYVIALATLGSCTALSVIRQVEFGSSLALGSFARLGTLLSVASLVNYGGSFSLSEVL